MQPDTVTRVPYSVENARVLYEALRAAGIDFVTYLPDSGTFPVQQLMAADPAVTSVLCAREDEGFAIAMGAAFASALGEQYDYHAATRMVAEPTLRALGIPYVVLMRIEDAATVIQEAQLTVDGQRIPVAVLLPRHIFAQTPRPGEDVAARAVPAGDGAG